MQLTDEVALITEASSGTGQATAELLAKQGAKVASDASSHITGTEVWIDGAESLLKG